MARVIRYYTAKDGNGVKQRYPVVYTDITEYWEAPRMWEGSTAFIIGGGPSLKEQDLSPLKGRNVIGVNDAYMLGDWINVCFFGDPGWFYEHDKETVIRPDRSRHNGLRVFPGLIVGLASVLLVNARSDIRIMKTEPNGFKREPYRIGWNGNSGVAAINLALHFGAKRIVLLGFDMKSRKGNANWHDNIRRSRKQNEGRHVPDPAYNFWLRNIKQCEKHRRKYWPDVEILNATPDSALPQSVWPQVPLESIIEKEDKNE